MKEPQMLQRTREGWQVRMGKDGRMYCTCPAWRFQRARIEDRKPCKHMWAYVRS